MADIWGLMPKSQTDPETIEGAIDRLIGVHEADEAAHLGVGESLQSHKASEIIDHAIFSVVADKLSANQYFHRTNFETIDQWDYDGLAPQNTFGKLLIHCGVVLGAVTEVWATNNEMIATAYFAKNLMYQATIKIYIPYSGIARFGFGNIEEESDGVGVYIKTSGGKFYGVLYDWGSISTVELCNVIDQAIFTVRIQIFPADGKIHFFINGVDLGNLSGPGGSDEGEMVPAFWIENGDGAHDEILDCYDLIFARDN